MPQITILKWICRLLTENGEAGPTRPTYTRPYNDYSLIHKSRPTACTDICCYYFKTRPLPCTRLPTWDSIHLICHDRPRVDFDHRPHLWTVVDLILPIPTILDTTQWPTAVRSFTTGFCHQLKLRSRFLDIFTDLCCYCCWPPPDLTADCWLLTADCWLLPLLLLPTAPATPDCWPTLLPTDRLFLFLLLLFPTVTAAGRPTSQPTFAAALRPTPTLSWTYDR